MIKATLNLTLVRLFCKVNSSRVLPVVKLLVRRKEVLSTFCLKIILPNTHVRSLITAKGRLQII